jgi:hypothetical protein
VENWLMVTLQLEAIGLVILQVSEHLWPEDLERAIPLFHAAHSVGRNQLHPLLLLVRPATDFIGSDRDVLQQILQPGVLPRNRPCRIAFLSTGAEYQETERLSERISGIGIRFFGADQEHEAKLWLLSLAAPGPFPPILG